MVRKSRRNSKQKASDSATKSPGDRSRHSSRENTPKDKTKRKLDLEFEDQPSGKNSKRSKIISKRIKSTKSSNNNATVHKVVTNKVDKAYSRTDSKGKMKRSTQSSESNTPNPKIPRLTPRDKKQFAEVDQLPDADDLDDIEISVHAPDDTFGSGSDQESGSEAEEVMSDPDDECVVQVGRDSGEESQAEDQNDDGTESFAKFIESLKNDKKALSMLGEMVGKNFNNEPVQKGEQPQNLTELSQNARNNTVKSPSDTTLYRPALRLQQKLPAPISLPIQAGANADKHKGGDGPDSSKCDQLVNEFINNIRIGATDGSEREPQPGPSGYRSARPDRGQEETRDPAQIAADRAILDAERFKSAIAPPQGMLTNCDDPYNIDPVAMKRMFDTDDDFFHVSCHVDETVAVKIEKTAFVELEKIRPKTPNSLQSSVDDNRMQLVNKDGHSYFVPFNRDNKINSVKKWDEAFRVYATIYTRANPHRAIEILQYVDAIHTAATSYTWENVYKYDIMFRHLMATKPYHSWAKTYTHMWNLCLTEPLTKFNNMRNASNAYAQNDNSKQNVHNSGKNVTIVAGNSTRINATKMQLAAGSSTSAPTVGARTTGTTTATVDLRKGGKITPANNKQVYVFC